GAGEGSFYITASLAAVLHARQGDAPAALSTLEDLLRWARHNANVGGLLNAVVSAVQVMADPPHPHCAAVLAPIRAGSFSHVGSPAPSATVVYGAKAAQVRQALGAAAYATCFRRGAAMTDAAAVDYLLDQLETLQAEPPVL